jgi:hypothetical protein
MKPNSPHKSHRRLSDSQTHKLQHRQVNSTFIAIPICTAFLFQINHGYSCSRGQPFNSTSAKIDGRGRPSMFGLHQNQCSNAELQGMQCESLSQLFNRCRDLLVLWDHWEIEVCFSFLMYTSKLMLCQGKFFNFVKKKQC